MNNIRIVIMGLLLLLAPLAAPAITMTSPNGGETLVLGTSSSIIWTASGVTGNAKLILLREDNSIFGVIVRDLAPGSSPYNWTVGRTETAEAPAGRYKIRVSTMDGGEKDVSDAAFTISDGSSPEPEDDPGPQPAGIHDFVIGDPVLEDRGSGRKGFRVTVTDRGSDFRGRLTLQQYSMNMGLGNAIKQSEVLDLRRGVPLTVDLFNVLPAYFGDDCGTNFRFDVNPDRAVPESDYANNVMQKKFFWKSGHDGRFFSLRLGRNYTTACDHCTVVVRPEDVDIVDANRVRVRLEITLRNCGAQEIRGHDLDVAETWDGGSSAGSVYHKTGIVIAPGNFNLFFMDVVLTRHASNSLEFNFACGEGGDLDANNTFHCHLNFIGF